MSVAPNEAAGKAAGALLNTGEDVKTLPRVGPVVVGMEVITGETLPEKSIAGVGAGIALITGETLPEKSIGGAGGIELITGETRPEKSIGGAGGIPVRFIGDPIPPEKSTGDDIWGGGEEKSTGECEKSGGEL